MFANSQMGGMDFGFPDVCLTPPPAPGPPVPVPYPEIGMGPMATPAQTKVLFACTPAHNLATSIPQTNGDNVAVAGVASGTVMAASRPLTGAFTVLVVGAPVSRLTSANLQNSTNRPGARIVPSQTKVLVAAP
ncbi:MAG: DUF4150 domain-containing protein [Polyangiaceae bacterium]